MSIRNYNKQIEKPPKNFKSLTLPYSTSPLNIKMFKPYGGGVVPTISHLLHLFDASERSDVLVNTTNKLYKRRTITDPLPDRPRYTSNAT